MKVNKSIYHFIFWLLAYLSWIFIFGNSTLVLAHAITVQFCYLIFIAGNYYYNFFFTVPQLLNKKRYVAFGACFFAGVLFAAMLRVPVSFLVNRYIFKADIARFHSYNVFFDSFVNILFWVVLILAARLVVDKISSQRYIEQIERERAENELNFLRAQFNPHFLFNSINSIYAHIDKSNRVARNMLLVFSEMLRYQLYECNVEEIELDREINYIRNYIAIQKSRIDERVQVSFYADDTNANIRVAPLIFITFIENAFKYVGFNEGGVNKISIKFDGDINGLRFTVFNTKDTFINQADKSSGLGIANVKRRLELVYPERHFLEIKESATDYSVILTLIKL